VTSGLAIAVAASDGDLLDLLAVRGRLDPDFSGTLEGFRHSLRTGVGLAYVVARLDGAPAGCGFVGALPGAESDPFVRADVSVVPERRGRGIGSALYETVSAHARSTGKDGLQLEVKEDDPESLAWAERRGFAEVEREKAVSLDLAAAEPGLELPPGIELVRRVDHPELEREMYAVGLEASADIPGDGAYEPTFEQWRSFEIERPSRRPELSFLALEEGRVVGFASLDVFGDSTTGYHGLTAVARSARRRGVGRALKLAQIRAAAEAGLTRLVTESEERNVAMRALNESLGYRPLPGMIVLRGPLAAQTSR
jgi:GNAT superfamily N-acetyltransferase